LPEAKSRKVSSFFSPFLSQILFSGTAPVGPPASRVPPLETGPFFFPPLRSPFFRQTASSQVKAAFRTPFPKFLFSPYALLIIIFFFYLTRSDFSFPQSPSSKSKEPYSHFWTFLFARSGVFFPGGPSFFFSPAEVIGPHPFLLYSTRFVLLFFLLHLPQEEGIHTSSSFPPTPSRIFCLSRPFRFCRSLVKVPE